MESENGLFARITGVARGKWLNIEFHKVSQPRVDLLFQADRTHQLYAIELQTVNDAEMPLRMAEYALHIYRKFKRFASQYVLYVGNDKLRMPETLIGPHLQFSYPVIDIRTFDAESLLDSPHVADAVLAILAKHADRRETIRRILTRIAKLEKGQRAQAFTKLNLLAGIRTFEDRIDREAKTMPAYYDIMTHSIIGPAIREGLAKGRVLGIEEGREKGLLEGRVEEARSLLHRQLAARFGPVPSSVETKLKRLKLAELEDLAERVVVTDSLQELFGAPAATTRRRKTAGKR